MKTKAYIPESTELLVEIRLLIEKARERAVRSVNSEMVILYWNIGKHIKSHILKNEKAEYGEKTVENLGTQLTTLYGQGYSQRNLFRMLRFSECYPEIHILTTLSSKLAWSHFVELIKIEDPLKREFYQTFCMNEGWSVRTFKERVNSMLYERTAISKLPEETIRLELQALGNKSEMSSNLFIRDPYLLDFLELKDHYSEKDLENRILVELERFLLEFGSDFAFLSRQKRIQIGNKDYYLDLLFYHRRMRRLVLIELKLGEFEPQYKGQTELYLKWLSKYERKPGEEEPIALILCASKENEEIELMGLNQDNIHVSEYWLNLPPKEVLEEKLHSAVQEARFRHLEESQR